MDFSADTELHLSTFEFALYAYSAEQAVDQVIQLFPEVKVRKTMISNRMFTEVLYEEENPVYLMATFFTDFHSPRLALGITFFLSDHFSGLTTQETAEAILGSLRIE